MNLTDEIYELLENIGYPVYMGWYREDIQETHITFFIYNAIPTDFSDNEYEQIENSIQFDVWGTDEAEVNTAEEKIRNILKDNEFIWNGSNRDFETETGLLHFSNRFIFNV